MSAFLLSPSGKVLVRRARCSLQPGPDPLAMPVLVGPCAEPDHPPQLPQPLAAHGQAGAAQEPRAEADLVR